MSTARSVATLPISRSLVEKLRQNGFSVVADLRGLSPLDLSQELSVTPSEALEIINSISSSRSEAQQPQQQQHQEEGAAAVSRRATSDPTAAPPMLSAKDVLTRLGTQRPIVTFCKAIDTMLGGGVHVGQITEFCGVPGVSDKSYAAQ